MISARRVCHDPKSPASSLSGVLWQINNNAP
ncbi:MAG: hypothetical protein BWX71_02724 [Deltaproteobacteria bacterium ADurb.Bin072]|nr:MAG: hypothetical protein BWX71_02724 [Deltaproteobacteria bacterium ADurb.Bin072]